MVEDGLLTRLEEGESEADTGLVFAGEETAILPADFGADGCALDWDEVAVGVNVEANDFATCDVVEPTRVGTVVLEIAPPVVTSPAAISREMIWDSTLACFGATERIYA